MNDVISESITAKPKFLAEASDKKIILVGNPNVGKSTIFNHLTKAYVSVSNYPGTTLDISHGSFRDYSIIDTPGVYSISSFNDEEKITREIILQGGIVLNVVDSTTLERDLFLTLQLIDMNIPLILVVNMVDKLEKIGANINKERLPELLGVPIICMSSHHSKSFEPLDSLLSSKSFNGKLKVSKPDESLKQKATALISQLRNPENDFAEAVLFLEEDEITLNKNPHLSSTMSRENIYVHRRNRVNQITSSVYEKKGKTKRSSIISEKIGAWSLNPLTGIPILIFSLFLVYQVIGVFVAQRVVGHTEAEYGNKLWEPFVKHLFAKITPVTISAYSKNEIDEIVEQQEFIFSNGTSYEPEKLKKLKTFVNKNDAFQDFTFNQNTVWEKFVVVVAGEFGAITMTVTYLLFLLLPLVIGFYLFLSVLEDCGYLPRLATMVDQLLTGIGLNGRAIIPIILGFGCVTMATITTRFLSTEREKTIASSILNFAIPCSAQLAVITALLARSGGMYTLAFSLIILTCLIGIGSVLNALLPGKSSSLVIDLPVMQIPRPYNVLKKTFIKSVGFMKEATPWFFGGALIISVMQVFGLLEQWIAFFKPVTTMWLGLPAESATAFVMGIIRRDFGAAGLLEMSLSPAQIIVSLTVITLFVPCIASLMALVKERGLTEAFTIWLGSWVFAFAIGGIVAFIFN